jgi:cyclic pyranopterin phosphate synthase
MVDQYGRTIDYMRISVTDRCNLRCVYCMPQAGVESIPHAEILSYEEILRIAAAASRLGIHKFKVTGGEPLVRKNLSALIRGLKALPDVKSVTLTTNGLLFGNYAEELKAAGLNGANFSLDTANAEKYRVITRVDALPQVLQGIQLALRLGLSVRLNCVPFQPLNGPDILALARFAKDYPLDVRFIELMPIGLGAAYAPIQNEYILKLLIEAYGPPAPSVRTHGNGPAVYYDFAGFCGSVGFISPLSGVFCSACNRIRLTASGKLRQCLCYDTGVDLKPLLRGGASEDQLTDAIQHAIRQKPAAHSFGSHTDKNSEKKTMSQIGG